jgi:hypothetical protein
MIRPIRLLLGLFMTHMLMSCSCGIYGKTYRSAAQRIDAETIRRFAKDADYRQTSCDFTNGEV